MARKQALRETTVSTIDHWTKTVGDKVFIFEIVRAIENERSSGRTTKVFYTNSLTPKQYTRFDRVTYEKLSREEVEELFANDIKRAIDSPSC